MEILRRRYEEKGIVDKSKFLFFIILIWIMTIIIAIKVFQNRRYSNNPFLDRVHYGDKIQEYSFRTFSGEVVSNLSLKGKYKLFLFFGLKESLRPIKYADAIFKRYKDKEFRIFAIFPKKIDLKGISADLEDVSIPIIYNDKTLYKKFNILSHNSATFLLDKDDIVRFAESHIIEENLMEILIGKFIPVSIGKIDFLKIGDRFPNLSVWDIKRKQKHFIKDTKDKTIFVFSSNCTLCNLHKYFDFLIKLENKSKKIEEIIVIFSQNFLLQDLIELRRKFRSDLRVYLLREDIPVEHPISIYVDNRGFIKFLNPMEEGL